MKEHRTSNIEHPTSNRRAAATWAQLDTTTKHMVDSLSPRRRSGERVRERGFQRSATIGWNEPLSPTLSPLVPRMEREQETSAMVGVSRCAPARFDVQSSRFEVRCFSHHQ
jgi:hypothetical protein